MKRTIKHKLDEKREHAFDTKVWEREAVKPIATNFYAEYDPNPEDIDIIQARSDIAIGKDISSSPVEIEDKNVRVKDHYVPIRLYRTEGKKTKVVLYIHGGGFLTGTVASKDNQCKYMAEASDALIISIEYRLSPEHVYPDALEDCFGVLDWMHAQFEHIIVCGDSAGGNLAAVCCLEKKYIALGIFIYGAFDLATAGQTDYQWDYSYYPMHPEQKERIMNRLLRFKNMAADMKTLYLDDKTNVRDPYVSPLYAKDFSSFPDVLMIEAEFDYYRICNEIFAQKLDAQGISVEIIDYEGLDHGFYDRIGSLSQAKDCVEEIAYKIKSYQW